MNRATCSGEVEAYLPLIENNDSSFRRPTRPRSSVGPAPTLGARAGRDVYISDMKRRLNCGAKNNEQGQVGRGYGRARVDRGRSPNHTAVAYQPSKAFAHRICTTRRSGDDVPRRHLAPLTPSAWRTRPVREAQSEKEFQIK